MKYIAFDTETGGLEPKQSPILTAYFAIVDENFVTTDSLYLEIAPSAPYLDVQDGALKANGIVMETHLKTAISREEAAVRLKDFLKKHHTGGAKNKLKPLGQNLDFDFGMIFEQMISKQDWEKHVHYISYDTKRICDFLKLVGIMPAEVGTLGSMGDFYGLHKGTLHHAKADVDLTIAVFNKMIESVKALTQKSLQPEVDLLSLLEK